MVTFEFTSPAISSETAPVQRPLSGNSGGGAERLVLAESGLT
jgi:hypothetical protein